MANGSQHRQQRQSKSVGDPVHIEVDVVAKYVESMLGSEAGDAQTPYAEKYAEE